RGARSWRLKYDLTGNGKRVTKFVTLRGTRKQAEAEAAKILAGVATGMHVDPSVETVGAFIERWLTDYADSNVGNTTFASYAGWLRNHVAARIGAIPIQKLQASHLQSVYAAMAKEGLSDRSRLHTHRVVSKMLKHATQWGVVPRNVATMVDAPR